MSEIVARIAPGIASIEAEDWDGCAGTGNPFLTHAFLSALEESGSATARTGWQPVPVAIDGTDGRPAALMPAYVKSHSQGEYVFDHAWAAAWERAGGDYYPKLQIAVPFTPVPGRRLLTARAGPRPGADRRGRGDRPAARSLLGPRHLHSRGGGALVRGGRMADPGRQPVPLAQ